MRANITLDAQLLLKLKSATEAKTKSKAVVIAIEDFLRRQKLKQMKNFKGTLKFSPSTLTSRHHER